MDVGQYTKEAITAVCDYNVSELHAFRAVMLMGFMQAALAEGENGVAEKEKKALACV